MRCSTLVIPLVLVASFSLGCTGADAKSTPEPNSDPFTTNPLDPAKTETQRAAHRVHYYAYEQKDAFVADMKKELAGSQAELDRLSVRINEFGDEAEAEARANLASVQKKWARVMKQLELAESATESTWDVVQDGFGSAYDELQDSFGNARQWLSERSEP